MQRVLVWTRGAVTVRGPQPVTYFLFKVCCLSRVPSDEHKCSKYKSGDILVSNHSNIWTWISKCPKQDTPKYSPAFLHLQLLMQFCAQTLEVSLPLHRGPVSCLLSLWPQSASTTLVGPCSCQSTLCPTYYTIKSLHCSACFCSWLACTQFSQAAPSKLGYASPFGKTLEASCLCYSSSPNLDIVKPFMFDPCCFLMGILPFLYHGLSLSIGVLALQMLVTLPYGGLWC